MQPLRLLLIFYKIRLKMQKRQQLLHALKQNNGVHPRNRVRTAQSIKQVRRKNGGRKRPARPCVFERLLGQIGNLTSGHQKARLKNTHRKLLFEFLKRKHRFRDRRPRIAVLKKFQRKNIFRPVFQNGHFEAFQRSKRVFKERLIFRQLFWRFLIKFYQSEGSNGLTRRFALLKFM